MVKMSAVWDETVAVIGGRAAILMQIAAWTIVLPSVLQEVIGAFASRGTGPVLLAALVGIVAAVAMIWGTMALIAVASDPDVDFRRALGQSAGALGGAIGALLLLSLAMLLIVLPVVVVLVLSGFDFNAAPAVPAASSTVTALGLYGLIAGLAILWVGARLALLYPVLVNERAGVRSINRSFALTRGLTPKILGILILYVIVYLVAVLAIAAIATVLFRLMFGPDGAVATKFALGVVMAIVNAGIYVVQSVFVARLYVAARARAEGSTAAA